MEDSREEAARTGEDSGLRWQQPMRTGADSRYKHMQRGRPINRVHKIVQRAEYKLHFRRTQPKEGDNKCSVAIKRQGHSD